MKVYLGEPIHEQAVKAIKARAEIVSDLSAIQSVDAIIARSMRVTAELMEKASALKVIGKHGIGYDTIDTAAARKYGIAVVYTPLANVRSVAELVIGLMIDASRCVSRANSGVRKDEYDRIADPSLKGVELAGKTLGLIGTGNIARIVAKIAQGGFDMRVLAFNPYADKALLDSFSIDLCQDLREMLAQCDYVSVNVPLTDSTRSMIGDAELSACKKGCILVNTARGGIVDENALYRALVENHLKAAASDVFCIEPPSIDNKLLRLDNFVATPHIGALTEEAMLRMGMTIVEQVFLVLDGHKPHFQVFPG